MKHVTKEKWFDFVNQTITGDEKASMERHLKQGCKSCQETVSFWQRVQRLGAVEKSYQPPDDAVSLAKAAFRGSEFVPQEEGAASGIQVLFDSFLQPMFAGARSAAAGARQMLYRAEPFQIDVQIEAKPGGGMVVSGQLLHLSQPEIMAQDTRVILSNMRGQLVQTSANEFGEFSAEMTNSGDLQMTISSPSGKPIVISLRDALGH